MVSPPIAPKAERTDKPKSKRRRHRHALREIKKYQSSVAPLIPKLAFKRVAADIIKDVDSDLRVQKEAFEVLQAAAEHYIVELMTSAALLARHAKRNTIKPVDMRLAKVYSVHEFNFNY